MPARAGRASGPEGQGFRMGSQGLLCHEARRQSRGCFSCMLPTVLCCHGDSFASLPPLDSSGSWFLLVCCPVFYGFNFSFLLALG